MAESNRESPESAAAVEATVARSLASLLGGNSPTTLSEWTTPSDSVLDAIRASDEREVLGILVHALHRWHSMPKPPDSPESEGD